MANIGSLTATLGIDTRGLAKAERTFRGVMGRMKNQVFSLKGALVALGGALALRELQKGILDVTHMAGRYEELGVAMKVAGENAGYSAEQMKKFQEGVEKSGIAAIEARQVLTRMSVANIDLAKSTQLARAAQDLAVVGAINSSEAFDRLIYGLQTAQVRVLRTIGLNVTFEEGYKRLAKQIGKTTEELTVQEKTQSRVNTVLEAATRYQGLYEQAMTSAEKQYRSLQRHIDNFKVALGEAFQPAYLAMVNTFTDLFKRLKEVVSDSVFQKNVKLIALKISDAFTVMINTILGKFSQLKEEGKLEDYFTKLGNAVVSVMKGIAYAGAAASDALRGVTMMFNSLKAVLTWLSMKQNQQAIEQLVKFGGGYEENKEKIDALADSIMKQREEVERLNQSVSEMANQPLAITQVTKTFKDLEGQWKERGKQLQVEEQIEKTQKEQTKEVAKQVGETQKVANTIEYVFDGVKQTMEIGEQTHGTFTKMHDEVDKLPESIEEATRKWEEQKAKVDELQHKVNQLNAAIAKGSAGGGLKSYTEGTTLPYTISETRGGILPSFTKGGFLQHFQGGGIMAGYSSRDKYLAAFRAGEAFIPPERVAQAGRGTVQSIIDGTFRKPAERIVWDIRTNTGSYETIVERTPTFEMLLEDLRMEELMSGA